MAAFWLSLWQVDGRFLQLRLTAKRTAVQLLLYSCSGNGYRKSHSYSYGQSFVVLVPDWATCHPLGFFWLIFWPNSGNLENFWLNLGGLWGYCWDSRYVAIFGQFFARNGPKVPIYSQIGTSLSATLLSPPIFTSHHKLNPVWPKRWGTNDSKAAQIVTNDRPMWSHCQRWFIKRRCSDAKVRCHLSPKMTFARREN